MSKAIRLWTTVSIFCLVVLFTLQDVVTVEVTLLFWTLRLPRAILLFVVLAVGMLLGWVLKGAHHHRRRSE